MEAGAATPFLPIAPTPWRLFGSFLPVQKGTRRRGGETLPVKRTTQRPDEGIGPYEIEAHTRHPQKTSQSDHRPHPPGLTASRLPLSPLAFAISLPLLAFGHFPLTGGIGPLTRGVGPQGEG